MKIKTKQSRPDDFVENPAATYMENNFRGLSFQLFCFFEKDQVGWRVNLHSSYNEYTANHDVQNCRDDFCKGKKWKGEL